MTDQQVGGAPQGEKGRSERLQAYVDAHGALKTGRTMREVVEREMLLRFVAINQESINEFPMLRKQQENVIDILCKRTVDLPGHEYVGKLIASFPVSINRYVREKDSGDEKAVEALSSQIFNTEGLLIKTIQAVVYACSIVTDNFEEIFIRLFGATAVTSFNELLERHELDQKFWTGMLGTMVGKNLADGFERLIAQERYALGKEGGYLLFSMSLENALQGVGPEANVSKTRIQAAYEKTADNSEIEPVKKLVQDYLKSSNAFPQGLASGEALGHVARLVCIDPAAQEFWDASAKRRDVLVKDPGAKFSEEDDAAYVFIQEQILALAIGAGLALKLLTSDFHWSLGAFCRGGDERAKTPAVHFDLDSLTRILMYAIEERFLSLLKDKIGEDASWISYRVRRDRRVPCEVLDGLATKGLSKIRRNKIFEHCQPKGPHMRFKARDPHSLAGLMRMLQLEAPIVREMTSLFDNCSMQREFFVIIDLGRMAKITGAPSKALNGVLSRLGVAKPQPPNGARAQ